MSEISDINFNDLLSSKWPFFFTLCNHKIKSVDEPFDMIGMVLCFYRFWIYIYIYSMENTCIPEVDTCEKNTYVLNDVNWYFDYY